MLANYPAAFNSWQTAMLLLYKSFLRTWDSPFQFIWAMCCLTVMSGHHILACIHPNKVQAIN